ncbi:MAG: hypothetical protein OEY99_06175 [Aigarchaeota archaeon]|nr:hypothetical protein [Aigarchaeota archaeon]MDH5703783.1 hypothetical protein [Aigarchaeota archaeon]
MSDEDVFELELSYVETPRGKVSAHETSKKIAEAIVMIQEENRKLEERIRQLEQRGGPLQGTEELKKELANIHKELEDVMAQLDALKDAFQEIIEAMRGAKEDQSPESEPEQAVLR